MMDVSAAPGGSSLGGVYAMKRAGENSDYAFEFEENGGDYQEFVFVVFLVQFFFSIFQILFFAFMLISKFLLKDSFLK